MNKYKIITLGCKVNTYESNAIAQSLVKDGYIEAIEFSSDFFNIGVQWHPEISYDFDDNSL